MAGAPHFAINEYVALTLAPFLLANNNNKKKQEWIFGRR